MKMCSPLRTSGQQTKNSEKFQDTLQNFNSLIKREIILKSHKKKRILTTNFPPNSFIGLEISRYSDNWEK